MNLYYETNFPDELYHWGFGSSKRNHKYIERVSVGNNKYRYFYSQAEYDAYMKNDRVKATSKEIENKRSNWTAGETAALTVGAILGGQKGLDKVADDLIERRELHNENIAISRMKSNINLLREQGEKTRDFELVNKANRLQSQLNKRQKNADKRRSAYNKTLVGKADMLISAIGSVSKKIKSFVSNLSKTSVKEIAANNPVTKLGKSLIGRLLGKKEEQPKPADKDLTVNGVKIKIRR